MTSGSVSAWQTVTSLEANEPYLCFLPTPNSTGKKSKEPIFHPLPALTFVSEGRKPEVRTPMCVCAYS